jgi:serine protease Do
MKPSYRGLFLALFGLAAASIDASELASSPTDLGASVFKLKALHGTGKVNSGSAVLIAPGKLLTTCHVTRGAESIQVYRGHAKMTAKSAFVDIEHDLCVLSVPDLLKSVPAEIAVPRDLKVGDEVLAVGYTKAGRLALSTGRLKALHHYGSVRVLQISAPFDHGQSGGALFDSTGRLVGITAFKTLSGGDFHFALGFDGIYEELLTREASVPDTASQKTAFWERARHAQPLFLRAASLEAERDWKALLNVAQEWTASDDTNSASWLALWRALSSLKRERDADIALSRAVALLNN